jgi:prepilin-type N-terminal cleavage/methylation domain-containing protein
MSQPLNAAGSRPGAAPGERRGLTLVELLISLVIATVVLAAEYRVLVGARDLARSQAAVLGVRQNLRAAVLVISSELRDASPSGGDLVAISDTAFTVKAARVLTVVCAAPASDDDRLVVRAEPLAGFRALDPERDSLLVFREGDPFTEQDDSWENFGLVSTGSATCADSAPGTRLTLTPSSPGDTALNGVSIGAPVRAFETVRYRLYQDAEGVWWLGVRGLSGGAWSATSPIAGPLRPADGVRFVWLDAGELPAVSAAEARAVEVTLRGRSRDPVRRRAGPPQPYEDSLVLRLTMRNP